MNSYLDKIRNRSLKNEQSEEYIRLCLSAINRNHIEGYVEKHHILPKCICDNDFEKKDKENLVIFTAKEHFQAHQLLTKMFEGRIKRKMQKALSMMLCDRLGNRILTPEEYEIAREANSESKKGIKLSPFTEEHRQNMSKSRKGKKRSKESIEKQSATVKDRPLSENQIKEYEKRRGNWASPMQGKVHTIESREKMSKSRTGKKKTIEHRNRISQSLTGRSFSEEHLKNMSISAKNKPKIMCEHCYMSMIKSNYTKWHGSQCKLNIEGKGNV